MVDDMIVTHENSPEMRDELYARLLDWFQKHKYTGEAIMQDDDSTIDAAPFLAELADEVFKFTVTYKE